MAGVDGESETVGDQDAAARRAVCSAGVRGATSFDETGHGIDNLQYSPVCCPYGVDDNSALAYGIPFDHPPPSWCRAGAHTIRWCATDVMGVFKIAESATIPSWRAGGRVGRSSFPLNTSVAFFWTRCLRRAHEASTQGIFCAKVGSGGMSQQWCRER